MVSSAVTPKSSIWSSTVMILFSVVLVATVISAAPGNPNNEDSPRAYYPNRPGIPSLEDNVMQNALEMQSMPPAPYEIPHLQTPTENAILNYLLARRLMLGGNNRGRSYLNGIDTTSNEISRKRSYSKYCAFNAVSCFGK